METEFENPTSNLRSTEELEGIWDIKKQKTGMIVFPNPFSEQTNVYIKGISSSRVTIQITDIAGVTIKIMQKELSNFSNGIATIEISRGDLPSGCYLLEIRGDELMRTKLIIK